MKLNANLPNDGVLAMTVVCTVILSIIFHGLSANPWAGGDGERSRRQLVSTSPNGVMGWDEFEDDNDYDDKDDNNNGGS